MRKSWWALIFVVLFVFLAYGGFASRALTLGLGWAVLAFSAWRRYQGQPARLPLIIGVVLVLGYIGTLVLGVRLP